MIGSRRWLTRTAAALGGAAVATGAAITTALTIATRRWHRDTARAVARLHAESDDAANRKGSRGQGADIIERLADAPEPVRRYFAFALAPGQRAVRRARLEHVGEIALRPGDWKPFTSVQYVSADPPGFVWDARLPMAPLPIAVRVRDGYMRGVGSTRAAIGALLSVGAQEGTPEVAASALWRWLAEGVWLPTALLPSERLTWTAVDDDTARATLRDRGTTVEADFHFGPEGEVERVSGTRYRAVGDRQVLTPTEGWHRAWARIEGMMIPTEGKVAWILPEGPHVYWRARLTRATYEHASPWTALTSATGA